MRKLQIDNNLFWNLICYLEKIQKNKKLSEISHELELEEYKIVQGIDYLQQLNYLIKIDYLSSCGPMVIPPSTPFKIKFELDLTDWIALQAFFPLIQMQAEEQMGGSMAPYAETLLKKLASIEEKHQDSNLLNSEMPWPKVKKDKIQVLQKIKTIEEKIKKAIENKEVIDIAFNQVNTNSKKTRVIPHEIETLLAGPILICETEGGKLIEIPILELKSIETVEAQIKSQMNPEILSKKIAEIKERNHLSIRAILKIFSFKKFNTYHKPSNVKNPYITFNGNGDIIWSATTEINEELLHWIDQLSPDIEIVSPEKLSSALCTHIKDKLKSSS